MRVGAVCAALLVPACDSGGDSQQEEPLPQPADVVVIPEDIAADAEGEIIAPPLGPEQQPQRGSALVTGNGTHLYKVEDVEVLPSGELRITTSQGNVADLNIVGPFAFTDGEPPPQENLPGIQRIGGDATIRILEVSADVSETIVPEDGDGISATIEGSLDLNGAFHLAFDVGIGGLRSFASSISGECSVGLKGSVVAEGSTRFSRKKQVGTPKRYYYSGAIGPVPVVVEVTMKLYLGIEGNIEASGMFETSGSATAQVETGATYDASRAVGNRWQPIATAGFDWTHEEPRICMEGSASLRAYLRPHFEVQLYSVVGPTFDIEPYLLLDGTVSGCAGDPGVECDLSLTAGAVGTAKVKADILDLFIVESPEITAFDVSRTLFRRTCEPSPPVIPPIILPIPDQSALAGEPYASPAPQLQQGSPPFRFSLRASPSGVEIDPVSGVVSWSDPREGTHAITIRATNEAGSDDESWTLTVQPKGEAPAIQAVPDGSVLAGDGYVGPAPGLERGTVPIRWQLMQGPPGMEIDDEVGRVRWSVAVGGAWTIVVRATNAFGWDEESWVLTVVPRDPDPDPSPELVSVTGVPTSPVVAGDSFRVAVTARNVGGPSPEGAINVSVVYGDGTDAVVLSEATGTSFEQILNLPSKYFPIHRSDCSEMVALDGLIEAVDGAWERGEQKTLSFLVTPGQPGALWLRVRTTMKAPTGSCHYVNDASNVGGQADIDQQGWPVQRFAVQVVPAAGDLRVTVKDQNGVSAPGAGVVLYTPDWDRIDERQTGADGVARWSGLVAGTYNLEAYSNGEFWASVANVSVRRDQTTSQVLKREMPYTSGFRIRRTDTGEDVTGGTVPFGTQVELEFKVANPSTAWWDVRVAEIVIDADKTAPYDGYLDFTQPIAAPPGSTTTFTVRWTPGAAGTYYRRFETQTKVGGRWVQTDGWPWGLAVKVEAPPATTLTVLAENQNGVPRPGAVVVRYTSGWQYIDEKVADGTGQVRWDPVAPGTYCFELYYNREYWTCADRVEVLAGKPTNLVMVRDEPYTEAVWILDNATGRPIQGTPVAVGQQVLLEFVVPNHSVNDRDVRIAELRVDRSHSSPWDAYLSASTPKRVSRGATVVFQVVWNVRETGTYDCQFETQTSVNGKWARTDSWDWVPVVTVR